MRIIFCFLLSFVPFFALSADSLNTHSATGNTGLDVATIQIDENNTGLAIYPHGLPLPTNPSGGVPFSFTTHGDTYMGDIYCLADEESISIGFGESGCLYGRSRSGSRVGPIIYQSNYCVNCDGGQGGPGITMWADRSNIDTHGNRGYMDIWAWGQNDSSFSNTLNFGNRGSDGAAKRRFRILNTGQINIPDLTGNGNAQLCIDANGTLYRGTVNGC